MLIFTVIFAANIKKQSIILYTMKQKLNDSQNKPSRYKKLNVFETFSGIGSQHKALKNAFKPDKFDIIATSEWEIYAIIAYDAIHHGPVSKQALKDLLNRGGDCFCWWVIHISFKILFLQKWRKTNRYK